PAATARPRIPGARVPGATRPPAAADPYAIGPDSHERAAGDGGGLDQDTFTMRLPGPQRAPSRELPKRVPKPVRTAGAPVVRKRGVDPEELRRRLGGFHQGAKAGRHEAEEEIRRAGGGQTQGQQAPAPDGPGTLGRPEADPPRQDAPYAGPFGDPYGVKRHDQAYASQHRTTQQHTEAAGETVEEARS
ncbi:hypothetical protein L1885_06375, partial [Streptomyces fuscigenes]|nr:hypothetical protein [Streptomyces fuscigenes]